MRETIIKTFSRNQSALESDLIIPVPLHPRRRRERGFNQAMIVARAVSAHYGAAVDDRSVVRVKHTEMHRAGMDGIDRAKSVERAFEVVRPRLIKGASALLIDDVYTTGSTINALTMALVEAGATTVNVFTIARV
jgi:ComF family protein